MPKTLRMKSSKNTTRSQRKNLLKNFQREITVKFLEILLMIKLFHWKTTSFATHKATDELYASLNTNIDNFIEVLLGKSGSRTDLLSNKNIALIDLNSQEQLKSKIDSIKGYLVDLDSNKALHTMSNTDLFNIRDEILGDLNKFLYLLTFK
jgi:DNA-binding ferritin-like protein